MWVKRIGGLWWISAKQEPILPGRSTLLLISLMMFFIHPPRSFYLTHSLFCAPSNAVFLILERFHPVVSVSGSGNTRTLTLADDLVAGETLRVDVSTGLTDEADLPIAAGTAKTISVGNLKKPFLEFGAMAVCSSELCSCGTHLLT